MITVISDQLTEKKDVELQNSKASYQLGKDRPPYEGHPFERCERLNLTPYQLYELDYLQFYNICGVENDGNRGCL